MADPTGTGGLVPSRRFALASLLIGLVGLGAAAGMGVALVTTDDGGYGGPRATADGFVVEPARSIGPDAFTPPIDVGPANTCDPAALWRELEARPEALREWARILGVPESEVDEYIASLRPYVLTVDTPVTNHGLHDGVAYARPSLLLAGTAVLMDDDFPYSGQALAIMLTTTTTAPPPPTTVPGDGTPVTRCRCGNPLLPPYEEPPATTLPTSTTTTTTTRPQGSTTTTSTSTSTSTTTTTTFPNVTPS
jgi:hypothetical protein